MAVKNCVCVFFNGYQIVPNPMIKISREVNSNGDGRVIGSTIKITLQGKIVNGGFISATRDAFYGTYLADYPCAIMAQGKGVGIAADGTDGMMDEERAMRTVFSNSNNLAQEGDFRTKYLGANTFYAQNIDSNRFSVLANGTMVVDGFAKVISYGSEPSANNWTQFLDYSIELEIAEPTTLFLYNGEPFLISSSTDDMSIEPLEETSQFNANGVAINNYFDSANGLLGIQNYHGYPTTMNTNYFGHNTRYKITRTVEAVGKHSFNESDYLLGGYVSTASNLTKNSAYNSILTVANRLPNTQIGNSSTSRMGKGTALQNAMRYVQARLTHYPTNHFLTTWALCNRIRTISSSSTAGTYRVVETSIAIDPRFHPPLTDDWTADISVDSSFLMTVKIQGTLKGYETYGVAGYNNNTVFGSGPIGDGSATALTTPPLYYIWGVTPNYQPANGLGYYANSLQGNMEPASYSTYNQYDQGTANNTNFVVGKYENAINGMTWLKGGEYNSATNNTSIFPAVTASNGLVDPYRSPIVNRARMFFKPSTLGYGKASNPYRFLNSNEVIATRQALTSVLPAGFNQNSVESFNPIPISMTESHRMSVGEIDYSFEFNNRPLNLIAGSVSEALSVSDTFPTQSIAEVFVIGRRLGPVLQDLGTVTSSSRSVTFEVSLPRVAALAQRLLFPVTAYIAATGVVEQFNPKYLFGNAPSAVIRSYIKEDNQTWNPIDGKLTITKGWVWQRGS